MQDTTNIKSPYIRTHADNIEEVRRRIAEKRSASLGVEKTNTQTQPTGHSSSITNAANLEKSIEKISKRVVGGEIRKFTEAISKEIEDELATLEERLAENVNEQLKQIETSLLEGSILNNEAVAEEIGILEESFDAKMASINKKLKDLEDRLSGLEVYTVESFDETAHNINTIKNQNTFFVDEETGSDGESVDDVEDISDLDERDEVGGFADTQDSNEDIEGVAEVIILKDKENEKVISHSDLSGSDDKDSYVAKKLKDISESFVTNGLLFRKNHYDVHLREAKAKDMLEDGSTYQEVQKDMRVRICGIIMDLVRALDLRVEDEETIHTFLTRAIGEEYKVKRKSFLEEKLGRLQNIFGM